MADIGMDVASLKLKCLEKEVEVDERVLAQRRIQLEIMHLQKRINDCTTSVTSLDAAIATSKADLASLRAAAQRESAEDVTNG